MLMANQVLDVLRAGGGLRIDGSKYMPDQLVQMARTAAGSGASLILRKSESRMANQLVDIARAGKGKVTFEFSP